MTIERARALRRHMTPQEVRLWLRLKMLREQGFHIRRQMPFGPYVADFACKRRRIIVEIDGNHHGFERQAAADAVRDRHFEASGYRVMRFSNFEIDRQIEDVVETIFRALHERWEGAVEG